LQGLDKYITHFLQIFQYFFLKIPCSELDIFTFSGTTNYCRVEVDIVFHSGKTRARQTAEILSDTMEIPMGNEAQEELSPTADIKTWITRLGNMKEEENVMLVGHLPYLGKMASYLSCGTEECSVVDFQNSGVVCLKKEEGKWAISWIITPELLA
jgi:phosphohistidine phosphatase